MPDPAIIDHLRDGLRVFRQASEERLAAERAETARYEAERKAAGDADATARRAATAKRDGAQKEADDTLAAARRDATAKRNTVQAAVSNTLATTRHTATAKRDSAQKAADDTLAAAQRGAKTKRDTTQKSAGDTLAAQRRELDAALSTERGAANAFLQTANNTGAPRSHLEMVGLAPLMDATVETERIVAGEDAMQRLRERAATVESTSRMVQTSTTDLAAWRVARQRRVRLLTRLAVTAAIILVLVGVPFWQWQTFEHRYQTVTAAATAGNWQRVRDLTPIKMYGGPSYRNTDALHKESFYQPAVAALAAKDWPRAQAELTPLNSGGASYKDSQQLYAQAITQGVGKDGKLTYALSAPWQGGGPVNTHMELNAVTVGIPDSSTLELRLDLRFVVDVSGNYALPPPEGVYLQQVNDERRTASAASGVFSDRSGTNFNASTKQFSGFNLTANTAGTITFSIPQSAGLKDCFSLSYGQFYTFPRVCLANGKAAAVSTPAPGGVARVPVNLVAFVSRRPDEMPA